MNIGVWNEQSTQNPASMFQILGITRREILLIRRQSRKYLLKSRLKLVFQDSRRLTKTLLIWAALLTPKKKKRRWSPRKYQMKTVIQSLPTLRESGFILYDCFQQQRTITDMSDEERELEQELDSDDDLNSSVNTSNMSESGRRAHHNALERKRRDHIKDSFNGLKDAIPTLQVIDFSNAIVVITSASRETKAAELRS